MQLVQTLTRLGAPLTSARTRWMFGFQWRFVRRCACDTDMPHDGPLPHTSQTDAMTYSCEELLRVGRSPVLPGPAQTARRGYQRISATTSGRVLEDRRYRAARGPRPQRGRAVTMTPCPRSNGSTRVPCV